MKLNFNICMKSLPCLFLFSSIFFSCSKMTQLGKQTTIFDLSLDTKLAIISYLDNRSLASLSKTCSYFGTDNNLAHPYFTPA